MDNKKNHQKENTVGQTGFLLPLRLENKIGTQHTSISLCLLKINKQKLILIMSKICRVQQHN